MSDLSLRSMAEAPHSDTAEQLVDSLSKSGYHVDLAIDGDDGLRCGRSNEYAVMTIDRILPGLDGLIVLRRLREDGIVTPALILSALGGTDDRVHGLRAGGDDYLVSRTASRSGREIAGQVVPRAMLLQHVWNLNFDPTTTSSMSMSAETWPLAGARAEHAVPGAARRLRGRGQHPRTKGRQLLQVT